MARKSSNSAGGREKWYRAMWSRARVFKEVLDSLGLVAALTALARGNAAPVVTSTPGTGGTTAATTTAAAGGQTQPQQKHPSVLPGGLGRGDETLDGSARAKLLQRSPLALEDWDEFIDRMEREEGKGRSKELRINLARLYSSDENGTIVLMVDIASRPSYEEQYKAAIKAHFIDPPKWGWIIVGGIGAVILLILVLLISRLTNSLNG